jgi:hypothetical protein
MKRPSQIKAQSENARTSQWIVYFLFILFVFGLAIIQTLYDSGLDIDVFQTKIPFTQYVIVALVTIFAVVLFATSGTNPNDLSFLIIPLGFISVTSTILTLFLAYLANLEL